MTDSANHHLPECEGHIHKFYSELSPIPTSNILPTNILHHQLTYPHTHNIIHLPPSIHLFIYSLNAKRSEASEFNLISLIFINPVQCSIYREIHFIYRTNTILTTKPRPLFPG